MYDYSPPVDVMVFVNVNLRKDKEEILADLRRVSGSEEVGKSVLFLSI